MRRVPGISLATLVVLLLFAAAGPSAGTDSASAASGNCSRATAKALIHEHPHLDPWAPIYEKPGAVLCGAFLGPGSNALVMSFAAATCGGSSGWAAFRRQGNDWKLAWHYRNGQRSIAAVGTDIKETLNILLPGDPRCVPTGGTKSRTWQWNGSRFVAGPWKDHYVNPPDFLSPDRHTWCLLGSSNFCATRVAGPGSPESSAWIGSNGKITLCHVAHASLEEQCFQNWDSSAPVLAYGEASQVGDVRCTSAMDGITCVKLTEPGKGNGFRVLHGEAVLAGPEASAPRPERPRRQLAKRATSRAPLWSALDGKVICGLAIHALEAPDELLCSARSVPAPKRTANDEGDPGFVFLKSAGRPRLALLSQYSWEVENGWVGNGRPELGPGRAWRSDRIDVTCGVRAKAVRCANGAGHGFTIKVGSYKAF
jgi:hypothetical protein